ncbi:MAG TPA: hypothetical protein PLP17_06145, partial [Oligoflexia bacterium]|nr:hypothetical protein [Oligoflexia bacterium]
PPRRHQPQPDGQEIDARQASGEVARADVHRMLPISHSSRLRNVGRYRSIVAAYDTHATIRRGSR